MPSYVAFLRAINLGAKRKFPKDDIRAAAEEAGFSGVETYINTGNVRLTTPMRLRARVESALEAAFLADRGFEVPTIVFSTTELAVVASDAEALCSESLARHYIWLLKDELEPGLIEQVEARSTEDHRAVVKGRAVHLLLDASYESGVVDPINVTKLLGVATNRNVNVVTTLTKKWC